MVGSSEEAAFSAISSLGSSHVQNLAVPLWADLSSQREVRGLANDIEKTLGHVDVLVNNAGRVSSVRQLTEDGIELQLAVNHLAPLLLTLLLVPMMCNGSRIVHVSSRAHKRGQVFWEDMTLSQGYSLSKAYNQSKLCQLMCAFGMAEQLRSKGITVNSFHPGLVNTGIGEKHTSPVDMLAWKAIRLLGRSPDEAASDGIWLATDPRFAIFTGGYFHKMKSYPTSPIAKDLPSIQRLMNISGQLVNIPLG